MTTDNPGPSTPEPYQDPSSEPTMHLPPESHPTPPAEPYRNPYQDSPSEPIQNSLSEPHPNPSGEPHPNSLPEPYANPSSELFPSPSVGGFPSQSAPEPFAVPPTDAFPPPPIRLLPSLPAQPYPYQPPEPFPAPPSGPLTGSQMGAFSSFGPRPMSAATRLMSAGAYLERGFRRDVIRELVRYEFRAVPPSYGYDAVTVLAHAMAARRLRRQQVWGAVGGSAALLLAGANGMVNIVLAFALVPWLLWSLAYLRRVATLQILITDLKPTNGGGKAVNGAYPLTGGLTPALVERISRDQTANTGTIRYSAIHHPFVGAGVRTDSWAQAEIVKPPDPDPLLEALTGSGGRTVDMDWELLRGKVKEFTVDDVTGYVERRLKSVLRDHAKSDESIRTLEVERRQYQRSIELVRMQRMWPLFWRKGVKLNKQQPEAWRGAAGGEHWAETPEAAREYLCIRVGSWDQELVTSMFAGFDLRGDTLHLEFHTYVLLPIRRSFHLIDRLPPRLGIRVLSRVAWDTVWAVPSGTVRVSWRLVRRAVRWVFHWRGALVDLDAPLPDTSELRLGRYALEAANRGARISIREMAAEKGYHLFFQVSDDVKYAQIIQRQLMESIELFLLEHNVDLTDHRDARGNIMTGDVNNNYGNAGNVGRNSGPVNQRNHSAPASSSRRGPQQPRTGG